jgi:hypothetical protein
MAKNNKLSRKREQRERIRTTGEAPVGNGSFVSGIVSRQAKQKIRRFSFQAHVVLPPKPVTGENDQPIEGQFVPAQNTILKIDRLLVGNNRAAKDAASEETTRLRENIAILKDADIMMEAIPHETVSQDILRLIRGYQDMETIAQRAMVNSAKKIIELEPMVIGPESIAKDLSPASCEQRASQLYLDAMNEIRAERKAADPELEKAVEDAVSEGAPVPPEPEASSEVEPSRT